MQVGRCQIPQMGKHGKLLRSVRRQCAMNDWTTLIPRGTRQPDDVHAAVFLPKDWPGHGSVVTVILPECILLGSDGALSDVRPPPSGDVDCWLHSILEGGEYERAAIIFICSTPEQAEDAARTAAPLLPSRERIALERVCAGGCIRASLS
jgi:hypothetical protein